MIYVAYISDTSRGHDRYLLPRVLGVFSSKEKADIACSNAKRMLREKNARYVTNIHQLSDIDVELPLKR